jgi:DNA-binding NarL/FixJ family response regulator
VEELHSSERKAISVIVADADPLTCALLAALLNEQSDFKVLATVANQDSLLRKVHEGGTDVALLGIDLADGPLKGLIALRDVREIDPQLRVVLLLNQSEPHLVLDAMRGGSRGVFSRMEFQPTTLFKCIRCVHEGQVWLNTQELGYVLSAWGRTPQLRVMTAQGVKLLSNREEDVVRLVVEGLGNREIAQRLNLSEHTIRNYLFKVFDKVGVSNRVELVLYATSNPQTIARNSAIDEPRPHSGTGLASTIKRSRMQVRDVRLAYPEPMTLRGVTRLPERNG